MAFMYGVAQIHTIMMKKYKIYKNKNMRKKIFEQKENFENSTQDIFPYVESAIDILDENLNWWKENWESLEDAIYEALKSNGEEDSRIKVRFIIFNGKAEETTDVTWHGPAIQYTIFTSDDIVDSVQEALGDTWNGHKVLQVDNRLIVMFE